MNNGGAISQRLTVSVEINAADIGIVVREAVEMITEERDKVRELKNLEDLK